MFYYKVKEGTHQERRISKAFNYQKDWYAPEVRAEIEEVLNISIDSLKLTSECLCLSEVPAGKKRQFEQRKDKGYYRAKRYSEMNKRYLLLCEKFNLEDYSVLKFSFDSGIFVASGGKGGNNFYCYNNTYIVETVSRDLASKLNWLIPIPESEFFRIQGKRVKAQKFGLTLQGGY